MSEPDSTSSDAAQAAVALLALTNLDSIVNGDYSQVTSHFDSTMRAHLSESTLRSTWLSYESKYGRYQSHGVPEVVARDGMLIVRVPLHLSKRAGEFRITFDADHAIAGLYILRDGLPLDLSGGAVFRALWRDLVGVIGGRRQG